MWCTTFIVEAGNNATDDVLNYHPAAVYITNSFDGVIMLDYIVYRAAPEHVDMSGVYVNILSVMCIH